MQSWRIVLSLLAAASGIAASGVALAKKKNHQNGHALLGDKIKRNGKHKVHKAGKVDVSVDVRDGKVVNLAASHPQKGNLQVRKVKSRQKLAGSPPDSMTPGLILAQMQIAQYTDYYYGYWFDDGEDDWYYWYTVEFIVVDASWVEYI